VARVAADMGLRASIGMILLEHPTVWATGPDEYLRKGLAVRDAYRGNPRVSMFFGPHAPYSVSDRSFAQIRVLADELDAPVQMHVHETAEEVANSVREYGERPLRRLERLQMVSPLLAAVHLTQLEPEEIALLAARSVSAVHCPESNLKLASGFCPVADLLAAGVNVALGTDGAGSNNDLDMFGEMRTCALLAKGVSGRADVVPAATVLAMATRNGARALGLGDRIGSLRRGKEADLICVDLARPATWPVYNPISQLVYATSRDQVSDAWVAGQHLLANGEPRVADADGILARAEIWRERIATSHD
jgi:5-methylthioadenosine/S-adenosylhomocysteine deaminase